MKHIIFFFLVFWSSNLFAQTSYCGDVSGSSSTAFVYIPQGTEIRVDDDIVEYGSWIIAVYENSLGEFACAGQVQWLGSNTVFPIRGADSNYEGYVDGQTLQFYIELPSGCIVRITQAEFEVSPVFPSGGNYEFGGKSLLTSMEGSLSIDIVSQVENNTCFGEADGVIDLDIFGPASAYQTIWSNGATSSEISNLVSGEYLVTISEDTGCTWYDTLEINAPLPLEVFTVTQSNIDCPQSNDGSAIVNAQGGISPYTFLWSNGNMTEEGLGLTMGIHTVTVTDFNNCSTFLDVEILAEDLDAPEILDSTYFIYLNDIGEANISLADVENLVTDNCFVNEVSFQEESFDCSDLGMTQSEIIAADISGNQTIGQVEILILDTLSPVIQVSALDLYLDENGSVEIDLQVIENSMSDNCVIESFDISQVIFTCTDAGFQTVEVSAFDNSGNSTLAIFEVMILDTIAMSLTCPQDIIINDCSEPAFFDDPTVIDNCDLDFLILEEGFPSGSVFPAGNTNVSYLAVSTSGDSMTCSFEVEVNNSLDLIEEVQIPTCAFFDDGSITVSGVGGDLPYTYLWNNGNTSDQINNLTTGVYTVTITDDNDCSYTETFTIDTPTPVFIEVVEITNESEACLDGAIEMNIEGGIPPYDYFWMSNNDTISNVENPNNLQGGNYTLHLIDSNGCYVTSGTITLESECISSISRTMDNLIEFDLYPNPSSGTFFLKASNEINTTVEITIYDVLGTIVFRDSVLMSGTKYELNLDHVNIGSYIIELSSDSFCKTKKCIKF